MGAHAGSDRTTAQLPLVRARHPVENGPFFMHGRPSCR